MDAVDINPALLPSDIDELCTLYDALGEQIDALIDRRAEVSAAIWEIERREWLREYRQAVL